MRHIRKLIYICIIGCVLGLYWYNTRMVNITHTFHSLTPHQNTTIFAAYSQNGIVPDYVLTYLSLLKKVSPNIIYITDNPIRQREINKLRPYVNHLIAQRHGEYDWGSYKRGYNWLKDKNQLTQIKNLIFANDSVLPVVSDLSPIFQKMEHSASDFWGITANIDGTYHLQSYFLSFEPQVFRHQEFSKYLNQVTKQPDGMTVAYRYEVPLTSYLMHLGFKSDAYIPYDSIQGLTLNDKHCYPLTMLSKYRLPLLKMRTFTNRLQVQEPRRLVFQWLKTNAPQAYKNLINHLKIIKSPYLKENKS